MKTVSSGTLVVALVRSEGVYLGADSRRTGALDDANKLFQLGPHTIGAIRGHAMLQDDKDTANHRFFARHFAELIPGPLPISKFPRDATANQRYFARYSTKGQIEASLSEALVHIEADWQGNELSPDARESLAQMGVGFGLTIAQSEPDGWLLLIDLTCQITPQDGRIRAKFAETSTNVLYTGPYEQMRFESFPAPECLALCPIQRTPFDSAEVMIDQAFDLTAGMSECCTNHVGGPIDIAVTSLGVVEVVRHKHPRPYFRL